MRQRHRSLAIALTVSGATLTLGGQRSSPSRRLHRPHPVPRWRRPPRSPPTTRAFPVTSDAVTLAEATTFYDPSPDLAESWGS